jgi:hypothetical protein
MDYSQSSPYEAALHEISFMRTFIMRRIPSARLVIRTQSRSSEIFQKSNTCYKLRNFAQPVSETREVYVSVHLPPCFGLQRVNNLIIYFMFLKLGL